MDSSRIKISKSDLLLYIYFSGVMFFYTIKGSKIEFESIDYILLGAMFVGFIKIINTFKVNLKTFLVVFLLGCVIVFMFLHSKDTRMIIVLASLLCAINNDKRKVINVIFCSKLIAFVFVMLFGGYHHINTVALHGGMILLLYTCREERHNRDYYKKILILVIFSGILILYTKSGSAIVGLSVTLLLLLLKKFKFGVAVLTSKIMAYVFPIALFFNYFFATGIGETEMPYVGKYLSDEINQVYLTLVEYIDIATSSRLTLVKYSFLKFGASWLGGNIDYSILDIQEGQYFNLDSGFIWLVQGWGYLMSIVFMFLLVALMKYFIENKEFNYIIAGIVVAIWAINEDMLVSVGTNFLLVFIGQALNNRKVRIENEYT